MGLATDMSDEQLLFYYHDYYHGCCQWVLGIKINRPLRPGIFWGTNLHRIRLTRSLTLEFLLGKSYLHCSLINLIGHWDTM